MICARGVVTGLMLLVISSHTGTGLSAGENGQAGPDRQPQDRSQKEPSPPGDQKTGEQKKKRDGEAKSPDTLSKPASDDKTIKAEEPPPAPPQKQEEPAGKKPVTSINLAIKLALVADPALFPFEIEVEMDNQKAVLTGTVSSEEEKAKAAEIARKVEGVESVNNKLSVSPALRSAWMKKQDEALAHIVKERLNKSETLKAVGFDVKSENGIISLSGKTRYQVIALEAAEAARHVPGVHAVNTAAVQITGKD